MSLFCKHTYKIIEKIDVYEDGFTYYFGTNELKNTSLPVYRKFVLQCEKCGKIKTTRV